jgi:hypothetical protein
MTDPVEITIRPLGPDDEEDVERLAGKDSARVPTDRLLGATMNGQLVAARSLRTDESIADPFVRTAGVRALLDEQAARLNGSPKSGRRRGAFFRRWSRASLPSSPPGAGGRLMVLDRSS